MTVSIDQLQAFVETAEKGSFRGAAISLGKHSSTVGELVANLEIDLGLTLFERSRRSVSLTAQGEELLPFARPVIQELGQFQDKADAMLEGKPNRFSLALDTALRCPEVSACYRQVAQQFPGINMRILSGDSLQVLSWLRSGVADVGMMPTMMRSAPDMTISRGFAFNLNCIVGPQVQVVDGSLPASTVRNMPQVVHHFMVAGGMEDFHRYSHHSIEANNANEVIEMVAAGLGWGYAPGHLAQPQVEAGRLQCFEIDDARTDIWYAEILCQASKPVNPAMALFMDLAKKIPDKL